MLGAQGGCPGRLEPGRPGRDGRREPWWSAAAGLLLARQGTAGHLSKKPRCSIRKGSLPRTNDGAPQIRGGSHQSSLCSFYTGPPESPTPADLAPISFPGGRSATRDSSSSISSLSVSMRKHRGRASDLSCSFEAIIV